MFPSSDDKFQALVVHDWKPENKASPIRRNKKLAIKNDVLKLDPINGCKGANGGYIKKYSSKNMLKKSSKPSNK